jgi:hypothetical protein
VSSNAARRHAWLELLQQSGPFLTIPVADRIWPTGLPAVPVEIRSRVRAGVSGVLAAAGTNRDELTRLVLSEVLDWSDALVEDIDLPATLTEVVPEHGVVLRPDFAFRVEPDDADEADDESDGLLDGPDEDEDELDDAAVDKASASGASALDNPWRMLGVWVPWGSHPLQRNTRAGWAASPVERLAALLRARDVPIGLVSDGRWWSLVWAPRGKPVGAAVWDATLWSEEPESLEAFVALLSRRRFLGVPVDERLPALLAQSAEAQEEVTTALGGQVRAAVEMLVRRLDELDRHNGGQILEGISDDDVYAGVVTVMMRVVFLLFAEERRLLPSDDARYDSAYSVGRLVEQLEQRAGVNGEQTLEHRTGAWHRLLALARALHGGVAHEDLRLPPYGGGLFDPDRFPWLEGHDGTPPAVDDLTVLRMLEAVQYVRLRGERRRLTFRALDVEQIGYVYEGLLELEVRTATESILGLRRQGRKGPTLLALSEALEAVASLETWVATTYIGEKKLTPTRRASAVRWLAAPVPAAAAIGLRATLGSELASRLEPLAPLLRRDDRDRPAITPEGGRYVAQSTRRASTGAHYTPRSLAEEVVQHAVEPLIYRPGPLDTLDRSEWVLRPSTDLLALRIADIAMGSGAFLVAACRFLADRVVEAWETEGDTEASRALAQRTAGTADAEVEGVTLRARRLVAEHCLYGVDINPLAVEMAKLSLWLVTMDRERPFGFLDDRLVCGDSLLGITSLDQLETLHIDPDAGRRLRDGRLDYGTGWRETLARAADSRRRITATPVVTVRDVEHKMRLLEEAQTTTASLVAVADALTGAGLQAAARRPGQGDEVFLGLEAGIWAFEATADTSVLDGYAALMQAGLPAGKEPRRPLHWPLVFPEVFADAAVPGFDAVIGNPPFLGGQKISGALGPDYLAGLQTWDGRSAKGSCDLAARFLLRADALLGLRGQLGYVTTNSLLEGATLTVGLLQLEGRGWTVRRGVSMHPWPSTSANLSIVEIWASKAAVASDPVLDGEPVPRLGVDLQPYLRETGRPQPLDENEGIAFQGSNILGLGFTMPAEEARLLVAEDSRNAEALFSYVIGADLNRRRDTSASRWIINFQDWPLERADQYTALIDRVRRLVKPQRDQTKRLARRDYWWRYAERASELYAAIDGLDHVLAISLVGNTLLPVRVPTGQVFSHVCAVFALGDYASLALLSSSVHQVWVIRYTSTLETRIRYAPSDVFVTFPRPTTTPKLHELGEALDDERRALMLGRALGLTKLYNQVHDAAVADPAIVRLREIHEQIDLAVLAAYGWGTIDPKIGHHPTKIGTRWTVSPPARFELLDRLLVENHRRAGAP